MILQLLLDRVNNTASLLRVNFIHSSRTHGTHYQGGSFLTEQVMETAIANPEGTKHDPPPPHIYSYKKKQLPPFDSAVPESSLFRATPRVHTASCDTIPRPISPALFTIHFTLKMEAGKSPETLVSYGNITRSHKQKTRLESSPSWKPQISQLFTLCKEYKRNCGYKHVTERKQIEKGQWGFENKFYAVYYSLRFT
jgi:hypothetical protein